VFSFLVEGRQSGSLNVNNQPFGVERFSLKQSVKIERPPSNAVRSQTADAQQNCRDRQLGCSTPVTRQKRWIWGIGLARFKKPQVHERQAD
jgi:hypothetical protein